MDNDLIEFVQKLSQKKCGMNCRFAQDVAQETLIKIIEENIYNDWNNDTTKLRINGIIHYFININKRNDKKEVKTYKFTFLDENVIDSKIQFNDSFTHYFNDFCKEENINEENSNLYINVKMLKYTYEDLDLIEPKYRQRTRRVHTKFKNYLDRNNIKLNDFYEEN